MIIYNPRDLCVNLDILRKKGSNSLKKDNIDNFLVEKKYKNACQSVYFLIHPQKIYFSLLLWSFSTLILKASNGNVLGV